MMNAKILKAMINIGLELDNLTHNERIEVFNELQKMYGLYSRESDLNKIISDFGRVFKYEFTPENRDRTLNILMGITNKIDNIIDTDDNSALDF